MRGVRARRCAARQGGRCVNGLARSKKPRKAKKKECAAPAGRLAAGQLGVEGAEADRKRLHGAQRVLHATKQAGRASGAARCERCRGICTHLVVHDEDVLVAGASELHEHAAVALRNQLEVLDRRLRHAPAKVQAPALVRVVPPRRLVAQLHSTQRVSNRTQGGGHITKAQAL